MPIALITGASQGLGRALALALAAEGWSLVVDARRPDLLATAAAECAAAGATVTAIAGDVADPGHRRALIDAVGTTAAAGLDLLVHNASTLGPTPLPALAELSDQQLLEVLRINVAAPLALSAALLPALRRRAGTVIAVSSDAAVEHYPGWGCYGAAKAALDHLIGTFAAEEPEIAWYAVDPGDMRTAMQQAAFPDEDISDRPAPESVIPAFLRILRERPSGIRLRAADWQRASVEVTG